MLYHPDVFLPEWFTMPTERVELKYTKHALYACNNDRYGAIPVFKSLPLSQFRLVEMEAAHQEVNKIVVRGRLRAGMDCVFVLIPGGKYLVKTVWLNKSDDTHKTLDRSRYCGTP